MHLSDVISWVGGGVVGVAFTWSLTALRTAWQGQRGPLRGVWWQCVPPFNDQPQKLDKVKCRHSGNVVTAQIQRRTPSIETGRMWHFEGRAQRNLLYGIFFSYNEADLSYGTIQLHKHDEFGLIWKGTYSRLRLQSEEERMG
jgi:hypothetical protein